MSDKEANMFSYEHRTTSLSQIDTEDDACRLSLATSLDTLAASIRTVGLINPPVLRQREDLQYQIVCGFRRVLACKSMGWKEIEARVLQGKTTELDALKLAILDNRSHRELNVVEQARGIQKVSPHLRSGNRLLMLSSLLGFPQNQKVFEKLEALSRLPRAVQASVADNMVSFEAAVDLSNFSEEDALSFFEIFKALRLSQNKQREVITLVQEIAIRDEVQPAKVLKSRAISTILDAAELNRNEKGSKMRAYLKRRRFPALAKAEERFSQGLKALKLDEHTRVTASPYFERRSYALHMAFKNKKELDERRKALDAMAKNPALKKLLEPFD